jgi:hypothetical protein
MKECLGHLAPCAVVDTDKEDFLFLHVCSAAKFSPGVDYKKQAIFNIKNGWKDFSGPLQR